MLKEAKSGSKGIGMFFILTFLLVPLVLNWGTIDSFRNIFGFPALIAFLAQWITSWFYLFFEENAFNIALQFSVILTGGWPVLVVKTLISWGFVGFVSLKAKISGDEGRSIEVEL